MRFPTLASLPFIARIALPLVACAPTVLGRASPQTGCVPSWKPTFGGMPGVAGEVDALCVFDDGSGPALYVGGTFLSAEGVPVANIARRTASGWSALGSGISGGGGVRALAVFDDGGGPKLYVGGNFTGAGGAYVNGIARWDGTSWTTVGLGLGSAGQGVSALAVYDDGSGPALYAGGAFTLAGGMLVNYIAKWDGQNWSPLGSGLALGFNGTRVRALAVFDDGTGPALFVGGEFLSAGGVPAARTAKWNGSSWSAVGTGMDAPVYSLCVYGSGPAAALYAGGGFLHAGGSSIKCLAKWDGSSWSALGSGIDGPVGSASVNALSTFDDGTGPRLLVGGTFTSAGGAPASSVAKWDGSNWSSLGSGVSQTVTAFCAYDDGSGERLYTGGVFLTAGGVVASGLATWDGATWSGIGAGLSWGVQSLSILDDGTGMSLYAGGPFRISGASHVNGVAKWTGTDWVDVGAAMDDLITALATYDDGTGPSLYAAGKFTNVGTLPANRIAKWDGVSWAPLGLGASGQIDAVAVYDSGNGPALYAGGAFAMAGGVAVSNIAKWDGTSWSALGSGVLGGVHAMTVWDNGSGPALYVAGQFTSAGGVSAMSIAKWNGTTWSALGGGLSNGGPFAAAVYALAAHDDGSGPALYAGGSFLFAGGVSVNNIAKWNGSTWSAVGAGVTTLNYPVVRAMATQDDGGGPALFVGGLFDTAGGQVAKNIAKWNGSIWAAVGGGMDNSVYALQVFNNGGGSGLYVAGFFASCFDSHDSFVAEWGEPSSCNHPGTVICEPGVAGAIACPCANPPAAVGLGCDNSSATGGAQLAATGSVRITDDTLVLSSSGAVASTLSVVLQSDSSNPAGMTFGQGVRCASGALQRMYVKTAIGGSIVAPAAGDPSVSSRSATLGAPISQGTHRYYGVYYRDPVILGGCPAFSGFNITQQLDILWAP